jgi:hypothetical protein
VRTLNCWRWSNGCDRRGTHHGRGSSRWRRRFLRVWRPVRRARFRMARTGWWWLSQARMIGPGWRFPRAGVVGPGRWRPRLVVMRRRGRFVAFVVRRRLYQRGSRRRSIWHITRATDEYRSAVSNVVRVERTADARSGIAPRARAFRIIRAHRWTRRIGWVIRAFVSCGWTTTGRKSSQGQRAVVQGVGSDCKADQHSSRAGGAGNDADRPGRFPGPPLDCICAYVA